MDLKRVRFVLGNMDIVTYEEEFRFQPKTKRKNMGHKSIILGPRTRGGRTPTSISSRGKVVLPI